MSVHSDLVQINRGLEQYAKTFTVESEEYMQLEFQLSRLLGYPQIGKGRAGRRFSRSQQFAYNEEALKEAKKLVQGKNTAAAQAQGYYEALRDADATITQKAVRLMAKNMLWILENKDAIYDLLAEEYGDDWEDSDTRNAYVNSYNNGVADIYAIFARDMEYRNRKAVEAAEGTEDKPDVIGFLQNVDRIREALKISEEQRRRYAREKRKNTRTMKFTAEEMRQMRKWGVGNA